MYVMGLRPLGLVGAKGFLTPLQITPTTLRGNAFHSRFDGCHIPVDSLFYLLRLDKFRSQSLMQVPTEPAEAGSPRHSNLRLGCLKPFISNLIIVYSHIARARVLYNSQLGITVARSIFCLGLNSDLVKETSVEVTVNSDCGKMGK